MPKKKIKTVFSLTCNVKCSKKKMLNYFCKSTLAFGLNKEWN